jgi:YbgC/YbaW family acyl-CoA thioester hydrolase
MQLQSFYTIRFNDCDPFGHLNNSRYIDYMLNAREDHLKQFYQLGLDSFYKQGIGWVVSSHEIQYVRPANYNETVCIQSDLLEAGDNSLLVEMRMLDESGATLKALLWTRFTSVNIKTGKRENHSPEFAQFLKELVVTEIDPEEGMKKRLSSMKSEKLKM